MTRGPRRRARMTGGPNRTPMPRIRRLDEATINRIAAGEVVERPASVVKELVENALDAGARRIRVAVWDGGLTTIRVTDDGSGMAPDEIPLALERHATSKLQTADDLWSVRTLGFRGEALPAIAAVSRLEIVTREPHRDAAARVVFTAGRAEEPEIGYPPDPPGPGKPGPAAAPPGTTVTVTDLFYNTPGRRKALKSPRAEAAAVAQVVGWLALAHPHVAFWLELDGRQALLTPGSGRLRDAVLVVFGADDARAMVPVDHRLGQLAVSGLVSLPTRHRASRARQVFVVNGRVVDAPELSDALEAAYSTRLMAGRHPLAVLRVDAPPASVDINVHPTKRHIRFVDPGTVRAAVAEAVERALAPAAAAAAPGTGAEFASGSADSDRAGSPPAVQESALLWTEPGAPPAAAGLREAEAADALAAAAEELDGASATGLPPLEPLGQVAGAYLVAAGPDGLYVVDQHAIAERLEYEAAQDREARGAPLGQPLLVPFPLELSPAEQAGFEAIRPDLEALGFAFEPFGGGTVLVRSVPAGSGAGAAGALVRDVVDQALATLVRRPGATAATDPLARREALRRILAACHGAITANRSLSPDEQRALLRRMAGARQPFRCLHGRPTILRLSTTALARRFRRT